MIRRRIRTAAIGICLKLGSFGRCLFSISFPATMNDEDLYRISCEFSLGSLSVSNNEGLAQGARVRPHYDCCYDYYDVSLLSGSHCSVCLAGKPQHTDKLPANYLSFVVLIAELIQPDGRGCLGRPSHSADGSESTKGASVLVNRRLINNHSSYSTGNMFSHTRCRQQENSNRSVRFQMNTNVYI
jgi:hypothetical protein